MDLFQIILSLALAVLTAVLVPLLIQLRRTAAKMEILAESAQKDLHQIATDVHEARISMDEVASLAKRGLDLPVALSETLGRMAQSLPGFFAAKRGSANWLETLVTGLNFALSLFQRPKRSKEDCHG